MSDQEQYNEQFHEKKYSALDMLHAFTHGRWFVPIDGCSDLNPETPEKNLPFWEWMERKNCANQKIQSDADKRRCRCKRCDPEFNTDQYYED